MSAKATASSSGIGFTGLLTILFIYLKLTHQVDWSWAWVVSPIWISAALVVALVILAVIATVVVFAVSALIEKGD